MSDRSEEDLTRYKSTQDGEHAKAHEDLMPLLYSELRSLAEQHLFHERRDHTLGATALVHEVYLKLLDQIDSRWESKSHFLAIASHTMRRILVDHARSKGRKKRGRGYERVTLSVVLSEMPGKDLDLLALDEALQRLAEEEPIEAQVVEMRFFGGMTIAEVANVLGLSERTVRRRWNFAKAWLFDEITKGDTQVDLDGVS